MEQEASMLEAALKTDLDLQLAQAKGWMGFKLTQKPQNIGMPVDGGDFPSMKGPGYWWMGYPTADYLEFHRTQECYTLYEGGPCPHSDEELLVWVPKWSEDPGYLFNTIAHYKLSTHHDYRGDFWVVHHPTRDSSEATKFYTGTSLVRAVMKLLIDRNWKEEKHQ